MPITRPVQPLPISLPGLQALSYGTSTAIPIGISLDRKTVYGSVQPSGAILYQTTNDGTSWTSVRTFTEAVIGLVETDDGEALCFTQGGSATPGYIYKSSGWTASHTTATWTKVLTTIGGYIRPYWGGGHFCSFGDDTIAAGTSKYGVVNEYGSNTTSSGDQTDKATRVFFTSDYGATWTQVLDLATRYPGVAGLHAHASAYDPYWDRLWVLHGDTTSADGTSNAQILYSDDRGATWAPVPLSGDWVGSNFTFQATSIAVLRECVMIGSDNAPGFLRFARKGYRQAGFPQVTSVLATHTGGQVIANSAHANRKQPNAPILMTLQSNNNLVSGGIYLSPDGGQTLTKLWQDDALRGSGLGVQTAFGPTFGGKILCAVSQSSTVNWLLRGELITPDAGLHDGIGTVTGDGTTTVFSFPHYLNGVPTSVLGWNEKPTAIAYTVTATASSVVITFATAPANAASIPFAWRLGVVTPNDQLRTVTAATTLTNADTTVVFNLAANASQALPAPNAVTIGKVFNLPVKGAGTLTISTTVSGTPGRTVTNGVINVFSDGTDWLLAA